jgi:hypothetical protein
MWKQITIASITILLVAQSAVATSDVAQIIRNRVELGQNTHPTTAVVGTNQPGRVDRELDPNFTKLILDVELGPCWGLSSGDLDGDGDLDIAISQYDLGEIDWYENNGSYEFTFHQLFVADDDVYQIEIVDLDGDGDLDIVYSKTPSGEVCVLFNDGEMNFTDQLISNDFRWMFVIVDLNQDGLLDVIGNCDSWLISTSWAEQLPDHTFTTHLIDDDAGHGYGIDAVDLDDDGDIDIVQGVINNYDNLYWYLNDGEESFTRLVIDEDIDDPLDLVCTDLDDDGDPDILVMASNSPALYWYENTGDGEFTRHTINSMIEWMWFVGAADIDDNGTVDVVTGNRNGYVFTWFSNDGEQVFSDLNIDESIEYPQDFIFLDIDEDGDLDIAMVSGRSSFGEYNHGQLTLYRNEYAPESAGEPRNGEIATCRLLPNYPNPFNPSTTIQFELDSPGEIELNVYNLQGQRVALLAKGTYNPGTYQVQFNGSDLSSGIYLYRMTTGKEVLTRKMILIR